MPELSSEAVDRFIDGPAGPIRLRTFVPEVPGSADTVMLNIHGGAWVMGAPQMNDITNAMLCRELGIAVVSVDYRLAPEAPYPAQNDDCEAAALWLLEHAESEFGSPGCSSAANPPVATSRPRPCCASRDRHDAIDRFVGANLVFGVFDIAPSPSKVGSARVPTSSTRTPWTARLCGSCRT